MADDVCQVTLFRGGDASTPPTLNYVDIVQFDAKTGIMTFHLGALGNQPASVGYSVFNAHGSPVGGCNVSDGGMYYCTEWVRDAHDNVTTVDSPQGQGFTLSMLDASRFGTRVHGTVQTRITLTYDDAGTLVSALDPSCCSTTESFTEDAQQRCTDVAWTPVSDPSSPAAIIEREHLTWDGTRLLSRVTTDGADPTKVLAEATYTYDADGLLSTTVVDGFAPLPIRPGSSATAPHDGITDFLVRAVTLPDGSQWVEAIDFHYYLPDGKAVRDGKPTAAGRWRWHHSPGCRGTHQPRRTSTHCRYEPTENELDVDWQDPFTTQIPR